MCKSIIPNVGRNIRRYSARLFTFLLIFVMLFSNTAQVWADTAPPYSYPDDTSVVGGSTINNASLIGVYLSDASNSDYSSSSGNYNASRELKAGIPNNASYPASQFNGADGNGVDLLPNFQIAFNENILGKSDQYSNYTNNKGLITLVKVNDDATESSVASNVTMNKSLNGSLFVSPTTKLEPSTSYKVKVSSGITADQTPVTLTTNAYEILFKTKALAPSLDTTSGSNVAPSSDITGVTLDRTSAFIDVGGTSQLTATVAPADTANKGVTWASDNTAVATVDATGTVTAIAAGTANITVTTADGGFTANCAVTVQAASSTPSSDITGVTLDMTSTSINVGGTIQLTATVAPADTANKGVTWASDNTAVATVDATGTVTAMAAGTATITVTTADGGFTANCAVTVQAASSWRLSVKNIKSTTLTLNWPQSANPDINTYEVFNDITKIATCTKTDSEYNVTGLTAGTDYTFTVKALDIDGKELGSITAKTKTLPAPNFTLAVVGPDSGKIGDTLTVEATINSEVDAYGFKATFKDPSGINTSYGKIMPDLTATQDANSGISGLTVDTPIDGYVSFACDPVEQTKVITAGTPLTLILKFKVVGTAKSATEDLTVNVGSLENQLVLFTDPGETSAELDTYTKICDAVAAGKALIALLSGSSANLHTLFSASVVFDTPTANVGGKEQSTTVTAKITAPTDKDVYGFETRIMYYSNKNLASDLQLDPVATEAANAGILEGKLNVIVLALNSQPFYGATIWVESDGVTPIIKKSEMLDLKLVFKILPSDSEGTRKVTVSPCMVLFTDPSICAKATGDGLTTIDVDNANMVSAQESLGTIAIAGSTDGSITLTRAITSLTMSSVSGKAGSYNLSTPADVLTFADAVNTLGYTAINATIKNDIDMTGTAFAGIGTKEHPFVGTISGGNHTIKIARVVTDGGSDVGGLVNYLGSGGVLTGVSVAGTITGAFGGTNVGGLVGVSTGSSITPTITSSVSISGTASEGANIGGIVGFSNYGGGAYSKTIYNGSIFVTAAQGSNVNVGGIAGTFDGTGQTTDSNRQMYHCYNNGNISGGTNTGSIVGSIKNGIIKESGNGVYDPVGKLWSGGGAVSGVGNTGGVAGQATGTTFNTVFNTGAVSGSGGSTGGIVGAIYGTGTSVLQSYNNAAVTGSDASAGGIVGKNDSSDSSIAANFNLGSVTAADSKLNAGGIVGKDTAAPAVYTGNYYIKTGSINSDIGDGLDNTTFTDGSGNSNANSVSNPDSFSLTKVSSSSPGIYIYNSEPPLTDADGTYLLSTVGDILWFSQTVNNNVESGTQNKINGRLVNNIDMSKVPSAQFSGIARIDGPVYTYYAGTFDGAGYTVTIKNSSLFGGCEGATIKNLTVDGSLNFTGPVGGGGIANTISNGLIENCHNKADINSTDGMNGGIAYMATNSTISNCTNSGNITGGKRGYIGGIVGNINGDSDIINCVNSGNITGELTIGGIAGETSGMDGTVNFINCSNTGKVISIAHTSSGGTGIYNPPYMNAAGGILGGAIDITVNVEGCQNSGVVTGTANNLGGIVGVAGPSWSIYGDTSIKITDSTNSGKVISTVDPNAVDDSYYGIPSPINPDYINVGGIMGSAAQGLSGLDISGNNSFGEVDKGIATNGSPIVGSGDHAGIGDNNTSSDNPTGGNNPTGNDNSTGGNNPNGNDNSTGGNDSTGNDNPPGGNNSTGNDNPTGGNNPTGNDNPTGDNNPTGNNNLKGNSNPIGVNPSVSGTLVASNSPNTAPITDKSVTASNPAPMQTNTVKKPAPVEDASNTSGKSTAVSEKAAKPISKSEAIYEVVKDAIQNNPIIIRVLLLFIVILAGLGGFRRYRKSRQQ
ncbi:beta strand repeat-containing protein [Clostridium sp. JNZ X4-2]